MALDKEQQKNLIVVVLFSGLFGWAYINLGWKPTAENIARLETEVTQTEEKVADMKRRAAKLEALRREYEALLMEVGQTEKRLPREKSLQDVLRIVTEQSLKHRVRILTFAPGAESQQQYFSEIPINLSFAGQFHALGKFLTALGIEERILSARGLILTGATDEAKMQTLTGSVTLLAYAYKG